MLTYLKIIFFYNLLPLVFLRWLINPFLTQWNEYKIKIVCTVTIVTIVFNNSVFHSGHKPYASDAVSSIPVEEYLRMGLQVILTSLWTFLCTKWTIHSLCLTKPNLVSFCFIRYFVISGLMLSSVLGIIYGSAATRLICSFLPAICCIWFVAGQYIIRRFWSVAISVIVPSLYFFYVDRVAIQNQIWNAKEVNSDERSHLQLLGYYIIVNGMIVFASAALDKSKAVLDTFYPRHQLDLRSHCEFPNGLIANARSLRKGLLADEIDLPASVLEDFKCCIEFMKNRPGASKFMIMCSKLFSSGSAQDFLIAFAFFQVADNIYDSPCIEKKEKYKFMAIVQKFIDEVYRNHYTDEELFSIINANKVMDYNNVDRKHDINWNLYESKLTTEQLSIFRSFSRMAFYFPRQLTDNIIEGCKWDIEERLMNDEQDLCEYTRYVTGTAVSLNQFIVWNKDGEWPTNFKEISHNMIQKATLFGEIIQIIDNSRDIKSDSEEGRLCVPVSYFPNDEYKFLISKEFHKVDKKIIMQVYDKMMNLFDQELEKVPLVISLLSKQFRFIFLSGVEIFRDEAIMLRIDESFDTKRRLSVLTRLGIFLKWAYLPCDILSLRYNEKFKTKYC